ncbi:MAG TPA: hypothetical protein VGN83_18630 [Falsiroseomonas sp.]|jgi:hypothetical protein|nr:hypothetical protein [Falsiroseomonas sp.]
MESIGMLHRLTELPILGRGMIVVSPDLSAVATAAGQLAASLQEVARQVRDAPFAAAAMGAAVPVTEGVPGHAGPRPTASSLAGRPELSVAAPAPEQGAAPPALRSSPEAEARILVSELDAFLAAMPDPLERRRNERIAGGETPASVAAGRTEIETHIVNIGRGGVWLRGTLDHLRKGMAVRVALPGAAEAVAARLVRHTEDGAAFAFHQDAATLALVECALERIAVRRAE